MTTLRWCWCPGGCGARRAVVIATHDPFVIAQADEVVTVRLRALLREAWATAWAAKVSSILTVGGGDGDVFGCPGDRGAAGGGCVRRG